MWNPGYLLQQAIVVSIAAAVGTGLVLALRWPPGLRQRALLRAWLELPLGFAALWFLGTECRMLGYARWLPGRVMPSFVAIGQAFWWLALWWPLRALYVSRRPQGDRPAGLAMRSARIGLRGTAIAGMLLATWAMVIEPQWLEEDHRELELEDVVKTPIRLVHVTDTQLIAFGPREAHLIEVINRFEPHLIVFSGDYITSIVTEEPAIAAMRKILSGLRASHGIFATTSDSDSERQRQKIFSGLGIQYLLNRSVCVDVEGTTVRVGGINHFAPRYERTRGAAQDCELVIIACHSPDHYAKASEHIPQMDLYLCGHTHGGQVQIPGFGPLITMCRAPRRVAAGGVFNEFGRAPLLLSRGVGMEGNYAPRIRLFCRPHVFLLTLR